MKSIFLLWLSLTACALYAADDDSKRNPAVDVINYTFRISVSDTSNVVYGDALVSLILREDVSQLALDLKNITESGKGMKVDSVISDGLPLSWDHTRDKLKIKVPGDFSQGTKRTFRIFYHGIPADGLIISENKYGNRSFFSDHWPDRASNYLPCVDHPSDKAEVDFIIAVPEHYEVVASGYLFEEIHLPGGMKMMHWKERVPLATKVMAFGAAEFDYRLEGFSEGVPVWTYVYKENRDAGFYDYSVALQPLGFYSSLIGPYSFEKLANVQSKTIFGGLENAGCIFYSENSVTGKGRAEGLIAHEIAHQWFGNSVTENDWHHIWLSEGFATYLTAVYMESKYGKERLAADMKSDRERVLRYHQRSPAPVIDTAVSDLMRLLNTNSYQKGSWILHMLRNELGDQRFWEGIRVFYGKYRNRNVMTSDFVDVMEQASGKDLDDFFRQWLYVRGQPELRITYSPSAKMGEKELVIEQKQDVLFRFPLELLINSQRGTERQKIEISERITRLKVRADEIKEIIPDPDVKLLFRQVE